MATLEPIKKTTNSFFVSFEAKDRKRHAKL